ncbi:MAG TPA: 3-phosphoshikimate 1-carboxyvinyltransferase [Candidatus Dormibacteraeota bacterium]
MPPIEIEVPGDKSIAHRALILGSLAEGETVLDQVPAGKDVLATESCLRALGVHIDRLGDRVRIRGEGLRAIKSPTEPLDCRNSGTTMRLLAGVLAGSAVSATLTGDASLQRRPMARVVEPLLAMGARVEAKDGRAPLRIAGRRLTGRRHVLPLPSAQVKSALLLAGLGAEGSTQVLEPVPTRDHTERLLRAMGASIESSGPLAELRPSGRSLDPLRMTIPGDFSSAAFWFAAAAIRPGSSVCVAGVGLNPSRTAFLLMLERMGAAVTVAPAAGPAIEPAGVVSVTGRALNSLELGAADVAAAIDEIPILMVVATQARGTTVIEGAGELRFKESDRIRSMTEGLLRMGARIDVEGDSVRIIGPTRLRAAGVDAFGDHRVAMSLAIAGLAGERPPTISGAESADISYPGFFRQLERLAHA